MTKVIDGLKYTEDHEWVAIEGDTVTIGITDFAQSSLGDIVFVELPNEKENLEARKWFEDAKFGLFIHWGVYSVLGDGEWVMNNQNIAIEAYDKLPAFFNPVDYDAEAWVAMAKAAGMKYITITSRPKSK